MDSNFTIEAESRLEITANICIGTATAFLNIFSMVCILKSSTLCCKQKILFTSMLLTDLLVGFQVAAVRISAYTFTDADIICKIRMSSAILLTFCTIFINCILAFDLFIRLALKVPYDTMINCRTLRYIMPCIVVLSTGFTVLYFMSGSRKSKVCKFLVSDNPKGMVFLGVNICLAFILILLMYVYVGKVARRHSRQIASTTVSSGYSRCFTKSQVKTNITVAIISLLFGISFCPLGIACLYCGMTSCRNIEEHVRVFNVLVTCFMLNSLLNPIAYIWRLKRCRQEMIDRILCRKATNGNEGND